MPSRQSSSPDASPTALMLCRRFFVVAAFASIALTTRVARALTIKGALPWRPNAGSPPVPAEPGPWKYFTGDEAQAVEALVDRLIPPDPKFAGGRQAGCAVYIDRQLAGPFGSAQGLYMRGPFDPKAPPDQGNQSPQTPAAHYRQALAELDQHCRATFAGKPFARLPAEQQDKVIGGLEDGSIKFSQGESKAFFSMVLTNTQEGFFADPLYGGNRDMVGWRMIGYPGARYDYRDWVDHHNERYPHAPVSVDVGSG